MGSISASVVPHANRVLHFILIKTTQYPIIATLARMSCISRSFIPRRFTRMVEAYVLHAMYKTSRADFLFKPVAKFLF